MLYRHVLSLSNVKWFTVLSLFVIVALLFSACQPIQVPPAGMATSSAIPLVATPTPLSSPTPAALGIKPMAWPTLMPQPFVLPTIAPITLEIRKDQITSNALAGNLLGDPTTRPFYVMLPPDYDTSNKRYPVAYFLPWGDGQAGSPVLGVKYAYQALLGSGAVDEMILVFPDGRSALGASLFRSSPTLGDYETYLTQELVDYVDANYRTLPTRDSRGLAGCSNGGDPTMRLAFKYPAVFSVAVPSGGIYAENMEQHPALLKELVALRALPPTPKDVASNTFPNVPWFIQVAAGSASNPDQPPLFLDMPFRMVGGKAEIVPEVSAKIVENDTAHEAQRYVQQPLRLRGILIQHALRDPNNPTELVRGFDHLLTELGIEHEYREFDESHCEHHWEANSLQFMSENLAFDEPSQ